MISARKLAVRRGPRLLFEEADFTLHRGERVGVTGQNGCGKSTLFDLILGGVHADKGELSLPNGLEIAHVAQETPALPDPAIEFVLDGDRPLRDIEVQIAEAERTGEGIRLAQLHERYQQMGGYEARARAAQLMHGLGFSHAASQQPVEAFSGGWRVRLNLAQALMCRSDLLLLDEPTNHLDLDAVIWLQDWLSSYPGTLLLISHDRDFLDHLTTQILHIERGRLQLITGNYSVFEAKRAEQLQQQQSAHVAQQREIDRIQSFVSRFRAQATKSRQVQSRLKALERMSLIAMAQGEAECAFQFEPAQRYPCPLMTLEGVHFSYGDRVILEGISLSLEPGQRIGFLGPNGAGKSTLLKLIAGRLKITAGTVTPAQDLKIGYFAQHHLEQLEETQSPLWHLQQLDPLVSEKELRQFLGGFGFSGDLALSPVGPFSGGEKSRLVLALLVFQRPNLLLLDEPTNHLDLRTRDALNLALQEYQGGLVIVSHDRHLLRSVTDDFYIVDEGRLEPFSGDLDTYRQWLSGRQAAKAREKTKLSGQPAVLPPQESKKRQRNLASRIEKIEQQLSVLMTERTTLDHDLADPSIYTPERGPQLEQLLCRRESLVARVVELEEEWLALSDLEGALPS